MCGVAYGLTGDRGLSEDLAQETFLVAWRSLHDLREPEAFRGWLCGIVRNLGHKTVRRLGRETPLEAASEPVDDANDLDAVLAERDAEALVWNVLQKIPETYREPLVLYYREGRSAEQVARALGLTVSTVEQRLSRGRKHLRAGVERMVERTLERTRPSAGFAAAVVAALPPRVLLTPNPAAQPAVATSAPPSASNPVSSGVFTMSNALITASLVALTGLTVVALATADDDTSAAADAATDVATDASRASLASDRDPGASAPDSDDEATLDLQARRARAEADAHDIAASPGSIRYELTEMARGR